MKNKELFVERMKEGKGFLNDFAILVNQSSEERINKRLRDFINYWEIKDLLIPPVPTDEYVSEDNQTLLGLINEELPEPYCIGYIPDDPGSIAIATHKWFEESAEV